MAKDKINTFIGIDISKEKLDISVHTEHAFLFHEIIANEAKQINRYFIELKTIHKISPGSTLIVMEHTGHFANHLISVLSNRKCRFSLINPLHISKSLGITRGKNDKIDAARLAEFALKNKNTLKTFIQPREIIALLSNLAVLRARLVDIKLILATPLKEQIKFLPKNILGESVNACQGTLLAVNQDIVQTNERIAMLLKSDERLARLIAVITSVPQIGNVTALQIILCTNEFLGIDQAKQFACYAGIAPFPKDSGIITSPRRVSHIANKKMKALLHLCALGAIRNVPDIKAYYLRKRAEGKPSMLILNAVRVKLVNRIFACVKEDRLYQPIREKKAAEIKGSTLRNSVRL